MKLLIKAKFDAAHYIPNHPKCGRMHGHTYHVEIEFTPTKPLEDGMAVDFAVLKRIVREHIINYLDHKSLNDLFLLPEPSTAENISIFIFMALLNVLKDTRIDAEVSSVTVWETEDCGVRYP